MTYILSSLASQLRSVITMSTGYAIALMSTMLMYILLPIILTDLRGETRAWVAIMLMTICQVFFFGPLAASFADRYGARRSLYGYALFFMMGAVLRLLSGIASGIRISIAMTLMLVFFAAGYACKMLEAYILRVSPAGNSGIAFSFLVTLAWIGRFVATLIQPHLVTQSYPRGAWIMIAAMICFTLFLWFSSDDRSSLASQTDRTRLDTDNKDKGIWRWSLRTTLSQSYSHAFIHGRKFIRNCRYFPVVPLSVALREGIFYGSLRFVVPLYLAQHPEYLSQWWEIGIYEVISVFIAVACGYLVDKRHTWRIVILWWIMVVIGWVWLVVSPGISTIILAWVIIALANSMLFASGQHILAVHDSDHEDDGAYSQMRQFVLNIGFMLMPLIWWYLHMTGNEQFIVLGFINIIIAVGSFILTLYLRYRHRSLIKQMRNSPDKSLERKE